MSDTIFALSSGSHPAALAIVRISGPDAFAAASALNAPALIPRRATLVRLRMPDTGGLLDEAIVLAFPGPASATGEDIVELHLHGGRATVRAVEQALGTLPDLRRADPGEFTRRALANGRLGLNEAEALADLLSAETESQRRAAIGRMDGALDREIAVWRETLLTIAARVEAALDHDDEGDVAALQSGEVPLGEAIAALAAMIGVWLTAPSAERLRDGVRVVLSGPTNAGKSSLFNALAGREAAIVDATAGTTRDIIEAPLALGGVPLLLIDTAGLRDDTDSAVETIGIVRAKAAMAHADIVLWLGEKVDAPPGALIVASKCDIMPIRPGSPVSAITGEGLGELRNLIIDAAGRLLPPEGGISINDRQRSGIASVFSALGDAAKADDDLIRAEEIRRARLEIDRLTGKAGVEDLLDTLFDRFCIGK